MCNDPLKTCSGVSFPDGDTDERNDGRRDQALDRPAQASGTSPAQLGWVPGGTTAVFTTYHYFDGPGFDPGDDLRLVDGATGAVTTLLEPGEGGGMYFYSPDGAQIALVTPNQIDLINSDGNAEDVQLFNYDNTPLDMNRKYTVAINLYAALS